MYNEHINEAVLIVSPARVRAKRMTFDLFLGISLNSASDFAAFRPPISLIAARGPSERSDAGVFFIA